MTISNLIEDTQEQKSIKKRSASKETGISYVVLKEHFISLVETEDESILFYSIIDSSESPDIEGSKSVFNFNTMSTRELKNILEELHSISSYEKNWDAEEADPFRAELIDRVKSVLLLLPEQPEISPTANNSIQLELYNDSDYLEIEIFEDKIIVFKSIAGKRSTKEVRQGDLLHHITSFYSA